MPLVIAGPGIATGAPATGATAVQCVPHLGEWAKELYVFQRTPSAVRSPVRCARSVVRAHGRTLLDHFLYLVRMIEGRARVRDAVLGGLFLALASLASWYHLLYAIVGTFVLFLDGAVRLAGK